MTPTNIANLISIFFCASGTILLFIGTYYVKQLHSGIFGTEEIVAANKKIMRDNARLMHCQKIALGLICISFAVQVWIAFQ